MRDYLPSFLMAMCVISMIFIWETAPPESGTVLAVFPPGKPMDDLGKYLREADASLVGSSSIPGGFLISSRAAGLPQRLKQQGALFVLNSNPSLGCNPLVADASQLRPQSASGF